MSAEGLCVCELSTGNMYQATVTASGFTGGLYERIEGILGNNHPQLINNARNRALHHRIVTALPYANFQGVQ